MSLFFGIIHQQSYYWISCSRWSTWSLPACFPTLNRIRHVSDQVSDLAPHGDDKKKNPGTEQYGPNDRNTEHGKDSHHECYEEPGHPRYQKKKNYFVKEYLDMWQQIQQGYFHAQVYLRWIRPMVLGKCSDGNLHNQTNYQRSWAPWLLGSYKWGQLSWLWGWLT